MKDDGDGGLRPLGDAGLPSCGEEVDVEGNVVEEEGAAEEGGVVEDEEDADEEGSVPVDPHAPTLRRCLPAPPGPPLGELVIVSPSAEGPVTVTPGPPSVPVWTIVDRLELRLSPS
mmetsp:Transcript_22694/g.31151  ORF Transcript_22694/g.31151 Transcript_22694/m.31151 type:complete len:116 (-) Transcript_22694:164-511(-)